MEKRALLKRIDCAYIPVKDVALTGESSNQLMGWNYSGC